MPSPPDRAGMLTGRPSDAADEEPMTDKEQL
jgi:hypothetical protein